MDYIQFYNKYYKFIYAYCFTKLCRKKHALTEDIAALTFEKAFKNLYKFDVSKGSMECWLRTIATRTYINEKKRWDCRHLVFVDLTKLNGRYTNFESTLNKVLTNEHITLMKKCMNKLSVNHRELLYEHYFKGKKIKDISMSMNIPVGTVLSKMSAARKNLKTLMITYGYCV